MGSHRKTKPCGVPSGTETLPEPESRSMYEAQAAGKNVKKLPLSLGEALEHLKNDKVIQSAMPDEMYKVFHWYKNDEWEKFLGATTQWDLDTYLDCLP